jgi:hypothetical protein
MKQIQHKSSSCVTVGSAQEGGFGVRNPEGMLMLAVALREWSGMHSWWCIWKKSKDGWRNVRLVSFGLLVI